MIRAVVTDIEGTTTPVAFVTETLFPYARQALPGFVRAHAGEPAVAAELAAVRETVGDPALGDEDAIGVLLGWIDEDRKATPLKTLQGLIWAEGYAAGAFGRALYDDVPIALAAWRAAGLRLFAYSSGSVAAQRLLFRHGGESDLTPLFDGFFDTRLGGKLLEDSYRKLAEAVSLPPAEILFLSDHAGELDAAAAVGIGTIQLDRSGSGGTGQHHPVHHSFASIRVPGV